MNDISDWLDEPQTVTTRRERFAVLLMDCGTTPHQNEMLWSWLIAAFEAGQAVEAMKARTP